MPRQSIKQRADGRYRVKYKGRDFYGATQSEAIEKREAYKRDLAIGLKEEALGVTFHVYASRWIVAFKAKCSRKTYNQYACIINKACASFGNLRLRDITTTDIQEWYDQHIGMSKSYIKKYCTTINSIFESAVHDGAILRNPCFFAKRPTGPSGSHRIITPEERSLVHQSVGNHDMALAAMTMLYAGLRRGEVLALNLDTDVDFVRNVIHVTKAVHFDSNDPVIGSTKSDSGLRDVPLFPPLKAVLLGKNGLLLHNKSGGVMSESSFKSKWRSYIRYLETIMNGCPKRLYGKTPESKDALASGAVLPPWKKCTIRTHDFRHSFCTMLCEAEVDIKQAIEWMGHSDEKMIMHIYSHLTEEREKRSINKVISYLEKNPNIF